MWDKGKVGRPRMVTAWRMRTELSMQIADNVMSEPSTEISTILVKRKWLP